MFNFDVTHTASGTIAAAELPCGNRMYVNFDPADTSAGGASILTVVTKRGVMAVTSMTSMTWPELAGK